MLARTLSMTARMSSAVHRSSATLYSYSNVPSCLRALGGNALLLRTTFGGVAVVRPPVVQVFNLRGERDWLWVWRGSRCVAMHRLEHCELAGFGSARGAQLWSAVW